MAIYCGVCADRIDSAADNYGSFRAPKSFRGWDGSRIDDTCESCAVILAVAVAKAATKIVKEHAARVSTLRRQVETERKSVANYQSERAAFEKAWSAKRAATPVRGKDGR